MSRAVNPYQRNSSQTFKFDDSNEQYTADVPHEQLACFTGRQSIDANQASGHPHETVLTLYIDNRPCMLALTSRPGADIRPFANDLLKRLPAVLEGCTQALNQLRLAEGYDEAVRRTVARVFEFVETNILHYRDGNDPLKCSLYLAITYQNAINDSTHIATMGFGDIVYCLYNKKQRNYKTIGHASETVRTDDRKAVTRKFIPRGYAEQDIQFLITATQPNEVLCVATGSIMRSLCKVRYIQPDVPQPPPELQMADTRTSATSRHTITGNIDGLPWVINITNNNSKISFEPYLSALDESAATDIAAIRQHLCAIPVGESQAKDSADILRDLYHTLINKSERITNKIECSLQIVIVYRNKQANDLYIAQIGPSPIVLAQHGSHQAKVLEAAYEISAEMTTAGRLSFNHTHKLTLRLALLEPGSQYILTPHTSITTYPLALIRYPIKPEPTYVFARGSIAEERCLITPTAESASRNDTLPPHELLLAARSQHDSSPMKGIIAFAEFYTKPTSSNPFIKPDRQVLPLQLPGTSLVQPPQVVQYHNAVEPAESEAAAAQISSDSVITKLAEYKPSLATASVAEYQTAKQHAKRYLLVQPDADVKHCRLKDDFNALSTPQLIALFDAINNAFSDKQSNLHYLFHETGNPKIFSFRLFGATGRAKSSQKILHAIKAAITRQCTDETREYTNAIKRVLDTQIGRISSLGDSASHRALYNKLATNGRTNFGW